MAKEKKPTGEPEHITDYNEFEFDDEPDDDGDDQKNYPTAFEDENTAEKDGESDG